MKTGITLLSATRDALLLRQSYIKIWCSQSEKLPNMVNSFLEVTYITHYDRERNWGRHVSKTVNLIKLSVGTEDVAGLAAWQATRRAQSDDGYPQHVTRMWPKRESEILNGGSIYWVIKGVILARQEIVRLDEYNSADGIRRCAIVCDQPLIRVAATPRRAFQGWRYLTPEDAPIDLPEGREDEEPLPAELSAALAAIGVR